MRVRLSREHVIESNLLPEISWDASKGSPSIALFGVVSLTAQGRQRRLGGGRLSQGSVPANGRPGPHVWGPGPVLSSVESWGRLGCEPGSDPCSPLRESDHTRCGTGGYAVLQGKNRVART